MTTLTRHHPDAELKEALERCGGAVSLAARSLGMSPQGLYKRIRQSPELYDALWAYRTRLFDTALLQLERKVRDGDLAAVKHALTLAKDWDLLARKEDEADGHFHPEIEPELDQAIQRVLGAVAAGGERSLIQPGDILPKGFPPPR